MNGSDDEVEVPVRRVTGEGVLDGRDRLAVEEPLEIRVAFGAAGEERRARSLSITMRTPGDDFDLALGFLFSEGVLTDPAELGGIEHCGPPPPGRSTSNIVRVDLAPDVPVDLARLERHFYTSSSCGICGKASLDALHVRGLVPVDRNELRIRRSTIHALPDSLRARQPLFGRTGGLHAAALVTPQGETVLVREDVGRHNAVDKVLGRSFRNGETPLSAGILVLSGRASFEILQKALVAGVPIAVAVGAPSSLAVDLAERFGMTVIGFASRERFNVYSGLERVIDG